MHFGDLGHQKQKIGIYTHLRAILSSPYRALAERTMKDAHLSTRGWAWERVGIVQWSWAWRKNGESKGNHTRWNSPSSMAWKREGSKRVGWLCYWYAKKRRRQMGLSDECVSVDQLHEWITIQTFGIATWRTIPRQVLGQRLAPQNQNSLYGLKSCPRRWVSDEIRLGKWTRFLLFLNPSPTRQKQHYSE